jgi:hypothetical protein
MDSIDAITARIRLSQDEDGQLTHSISEPLL